MSGLYSGNLLDRLKAGAERVAPSWGLSPQTSVRLLTVSENATFIAEDPARDQPVILRVHRPNYCTREDIASELNWITALRENEVVPTPEVLIMKDGDRIASFQDGDDTRHVVAFSFMSGKEPEEDENLISGFEILGAISAKLHEHAKTWGRPADFTRRTWNFETSLGGTPHWGDWRAALGLTPSGREILERLCVVLREKLDDYGDSPDRYGLIHADLRLANLLVDGDRLGVIDFDDCGFSWFIYDFASATSFIETSPQMPALKDAWVKGYSSHMPLGDEHVAMIPTFVMFRRLLLTAWIASHPETETAAEAGLGAFTDGTVELAENYLSENVS